MSLLNETLLQLMRDWWRIQFATNLEEDMFMRLFLEFFGKPKGLGVDPNGG
ncbi:MAG: hypothetical protein ACREMY_23950 [bacterium]